MLLGNQIMDVVFTIRRADLKRAIKELKVNRGGEGTDDLIYLLVSEYAATFRAVGTESEYPVNGIGPGCAQLPIVVLERIAEMRTSTELQLRVTAGAVLCGSATVRNRAITLGQIPDTSIRVPIDPSDFELIVIGRVLGDLVAAEQGLQSRLECARAELRLAICAAAMNVASYGVSESDIELLIEKAIKDAESRITKGLYT